MSNKTEMTPKQAAEKLKELLLEKQDIEEQVDRLTSAKEAIATDNRNGKRPKSAIYVDAQSCRHETQFNVDFDVLVGAIGTMLNQHADRLDEINDTLLFMVKLIK